MNLPTTTDDLLDALDRSSAAVARLVDGVRPEQWSAPTPCTEWTVREVVAHLAGMNRVFTAMLTDTRRPERASLDDAELPDAFRTTSAALLSAFGTPGVLERHFAGPLRSSTGTERLQIRLYDLVAHGWDVARATGQEDQLPPDAAELALAFARTQLLDQARPGRFAPARGTPTTASAVDRLVAFLGRPAHWDPGAAGKNEA